ncbi:hypothetical protein EVA_17373 [gut metagenome]|uniref:Uncharacterized protein n=1 Tax=gut metagenome TaxID=749906 RepID=J9C3X8_9ZZZZ
MVSWLMVLRFTSFGIRFMTVFLQPIRTRFAIRLWQT